MKIAILALTWQLAQVVVVVAFQPLQATPSMKIRLWLTSSSSTSSHRSSPLRLAVEEDDNNNSNNDDDNTAPNLEGKTVYKRTLFRLQPTPALPIPNALVLEERLRYRPSANDPTFMEPFGPRTLLLRDGQVEEGAIGDEFYTIHVHEVPPSKATSVGSTTLQHGGRAGALDESLVLALVMAAQPECFHGPVLEIAARQGLGALVGCLGAAFATQTPEQRAERNVKVTDQEEEEDVLTLPVDHYSDKILYKGLTTLIITESDPVMLDLCVENADSVPSKKIHVQALDWRTRALPMAAGRQQRREYVTVALADLPLTFPETREMARTVAHRVAPSNPELASWTLAASNRGGDDDDTKDGPLPTPRFIHVSREGREESVYLRKYLTEGCRMNVNTDFCTVEKIGFAIQSIDTVPPSEENALLDPLELEVASMDEMVYQIMTAEHHIDYTGSGSGEVFFPMEAASDFSVGYRGDGPRSGPEPARGSFLG